MGLLEDLEYFKLTSQGQRQARCLLIDTEPKVVQQVLASSSTGSNLFSRERCYLGQSGRGNNWAFGYTQWQPRSQARGPGGAGGGWDGSSQVATPSHREFLILDAVTEGIRQEAEEADGAPNFLLLHSLGGGSGSGLGSRLLEHLRESLSSSAAEARGGGQRLNGLEYPLNYIATLSVAPRSAGDSALQSLNAAMALSFLQAYADVVLLFDNGSMLEEAGRQHKSVGLQEVNRGMAAAALGALWPLDANEARAAGGRIRDMACTVAADPCLKLLETRTVAVHANLGAQQPYRPAPASSGSGSTAAAEAVAAAAAAGVWRDAVKAAARLLPRYDPWQPDTPVVTVGSTQTKAAATSRPPGFQGPADLRMPAKNGHGAGPGAINVLEQRVQQPGPTQHPAVPHFVAATGGPASFGTPDEIGGAVWVRQGAARLVCGELPGVTGTAKPAPGKGLGPASATMALSVVACRSSALGLLSSTLNRAKALCDAGAYLHWYERHGCSKEAVQEALYSVQDVADSYRLATGIREQFGPG
ncbi:Eta tubulin [Haematococcus lacustris]